MGNIIVISIFFLTFVQGIVGSRDPMTREKLIPPFPFFNNYNKDKDIKRISNMTKRKTLPEVVSKLKKVWGNTYDYSLITDYVNNTLELGFKKPENMESIKDKFHKIKLHNYS